MVAFGALHALAASFASVTVAFVAFASVKVKYKLGGVVGPLVAVVDKIVVTLEAAEQVEVVVRKIVEIFGIVVAILSVVAIIEFVVIMVAVAARIVVVAKVEVVAGHMYVEKEEAVVAVRMVAVKEVEVVVE